MKPEVVLIGPGRVGAAIGRKLHDAGFPFTAVISRDQQRGLDATGFIGCDPSIATTDLCQARQGDIILLAVPDDQIRAMAQRLQDDIGLTREPTLVHFSGLQPADTMKVAGSNVATISIHPLLPFVNREMACAGLTGCPCAIEGDVARLSLAKKLVTAIGGKAFHLRTDTKARYHAAACITSNYLVTLTAAALELMVQCGFNQQQAMELLSPIHRATSDNLITLGAEAALTGPIVRGDIGTVKEHIWALEENAPDFCELYSCLGKKTVDLARISGRLQEEKAIQLQNILTASEDDKRDT